MYIGSTGYDGLHHLIKEIADNSIDEAIAGFANRIDITIAEEQYIISDIVGQEPNIEEYLSIYQSTSPSYVFMATMEACIEKMDHERDGLFIVYKHLLAEYRKKFEGFSHIHLVSESDFKKNSIYDYDDGKLVFSVKNCGIPKEDGVQVVNGVILGEMLEKEYGQVMEMAAGSYVIAMTSVADTKDAFEALYQALEAIDSQLTDLEVNADNNKEDAVNYAMSLDRKMTIAEAKESNLTEVFLKL